MRFFTTALCLLALDFVRAGEPMCTDAEDYEYADGSTKRGSSLQASHMLISELDIYASRTTVDLVPRSGTPWGIIATKGMVSIGIELVDYPNVVQPDRVSIEELVAGVHALVTTCTSGTVSVGTGVWQVSLNAYNEGTGEVPPARRHAGAGTDAGTDADAANREDRGAAPGRRATAGTHWDSFNNINDFEMLSLHLPVFSTIFGHSVRPWDAAVEAPLLDDGASQLSSLLTAAKDTADVLHWTSEPSGTNYDISLRLVGIDTWGSILGDDTASNGMLRQMTRLGAADVAGRGTTRAVFQLNSQAGDDQGMVMDVTRTLVADEDGSPSRCEPKPGLFVPPLYPDEDEGGDGDGDGEEDEDGLLTPATGPGNNGKNVTTRFHQPVRRGALERRPPFQVCNVRYVEHFTPSTCSSKYLPCTDNAQADNIIGDDNKWGDWKLSKPIREDNPRSTICDFEWRLDWPDRLPPSNDGPNEYNTEHVYELGLFKYFMEHVKRKDQGCTNLDTQLTDNFLPGGPAGQLISPIKAVENCLPSGATPDILFIVNANVNNAKNKLLKADPADDFWGQMLPRYNAKKSLYVGASVAEYMNEDRVRAAFKQTHDCVRDVLRDTDTRFNGAGHISWQTRYLEWINDYLGMRSAKLESWAEWRVSQARTDCGSDEECLKDIDAMRARNWRPDYFRLHPDYFNLT